MVAKGPGGRAKAVILLMFTIGTLTQRWGGGGTLDSEMVKGDKKTKALSVFL